MCEVVRSDGPYPDGKRRLTPGVRNRLRRALVALSFAVATAAAQADKDELRDPFMPPGWNEPSASSEPAFNASAWTLESTLTSNGRSVAIINGRAVRVGDDVGGARIVDVTRGSARLEYNGHRFTIRRPGTQVRTSREPVQ